MNTNLGNQILKLQSIKVTLKVIFSVIVSIVFFVLLTVLTQVGGIIYLLSLGINHFLKKRISTSWIKMFLKPVLFTGLYLFFIFLIIPFLAQYFNRTPLPVWDKNLKPLTIWTCVLNRHYVTSELRHVMIDASNNMAQRYPGASIQYLDAGFPLFKRFPLFPHLSHNDGKKIDITLFYKFKDTGEPTRSTPSFIGYGVSELPRKDEFDMANECTEKGFWQYSLLSKIIQPLASNDYQFDPDRTRALLKILATQKKIQKIFIEPHLKQRLKLSDKKFRFHGCQAVRHDDHIHVQL